MDEAGDSTDMADTTNGEGTVSGGVKSINHLRELCLPLSSGRASITLPRTDGSKSFNSFRYGF